MNNDEPWLERAKALFLELGVLELGGVSLSMIAAIARA